MSGRKVLMISLAAALAVGTVALAAQGSQDDPLVTLSYLTKVVTPQMEQKVDEAVSKNESELKQQLDIAITSYENRVDEALAAAGSAVFSSRSLKSKETFTLPAGREMLLVSGSATAVGSLTDTTSGSAVQAGAKLTAGHLYLTLEPSSGFAATAACSVMSR